MHFYDSVGKSHHTIIGKNGKERDTTLRDAKILRLFPSVTTVMDVQAKPALIVWLQNELLTACLNDPFNPYEWDEETWRKHVLQGMRAKTKKAAERGTEIHNKLEDYFKTGKVCKQDKEYITPAIELIESKWPDTKWIAEKSFTNIEHGFGGSVDLHSENVIIDFKTKEKDNIKEIKQYDDHYIQLAAYHVGLGLAPQAERYNLFISTHEDTKGECSLLQAAEFDKYWNMFKTLTEFWRLKNNYDPRAEI